ITAKMMTTNNVLITRTLRAAPGVEPARASVVVSTTEGSECLGSAIMLSSRIQRSPGQRAEVSGVPRLRSWNGCRVEEQCLGDRRLHGRALEGIRDEEGRLGPRSRKQTLGEGGDEDHRDRKFRENVLHRI